VDDGEDAVTGIVAVFAAVLGLVIGSFLNVVIWRVPRGESVVHPPSHCPRCESEIRPADNIPVVSWLMLRGRCRHCGEPISVRYPLVELATGVLFACVALRFGPHVVQLAYLYLAAVGIALTMIDLDHKRLPDVLTLPSYAVVIALLGLAVLLDHVGHTPFVRALLGGLALYAFYEVIAFIQPRGMGGGDVKLSGVLGLALAWISWGALVVGAFAAFLIGGVVSIGLVLFAGAGRKTKVPFGPFMIAGAFVGIFAGQQIAHAYTSFTFG
jgi:leader peptidase (prepilin peptidase) / N-methyltransferase